MTLFDVDEGELITSRFSVMNASAREDHSELSVSWKSLFISTLARSVSGGKMDVAVSGVYTSVLPTLSGNSSSGRAIRVGLVAFAEFALPLTISVGLLAGGTISLYGSFIFGADVVVVVVVVVAVLAGSRRGNARPRVPDPGAITRSGAAGAVGGRGGGVGVDRVDRFDAPELGLSPVDEEDEDEPVVFMNSSRSFCISSWISFLIGVSKVASSRFPRDSQCELNIIKAERAAIRASETASVTPLFIVASNWST